MHVNSSSPVFKNSLLKKCDYFPSLVLLAELMWLSVLKYLTIKQKAVQNKENNRES